MNAQNMFWHKMRFRTQEEPEGLAPRLSVLQSCRRQRARAAAVTADLLVPLSTARNPKAGQLLTAGDQHKHSQQHLAILKQNIYTSWDQIDWTQHAATPSGLDLVISVSVPTLTIPWPCKIPQPAGASWDGDSLAECWEEEGEGGKKLRGLPLWGEKGNEATQPSKHWLGCSWMRCTKGAHTFLFTMHWLLHMLYENFPTRCYVLLQDGWSEICSLRASLLMRVQFLTLKQCHNTPLPDENF